MSTQKFTRAMGRFAPTRFYDPVVALTRERLWRALAAKYPAVQWCVGMGDALVESLGSHSVDTAGSSRVLRASPDRAGSAARLRG
jgi:hypothetical protein